MNLSVTLPAMRGSMIVCHGYNGCMVVRYAYKESWKSTQ